MYARQNHGAFDFEQSNLFESNHVDKQTFAPSAKLPQIMRSKSNNFVEPQIESSNNVRIEQRPAKLLASAVQHQISHEYPRSPNALDVENSFHRVRFDSMFRAKPIENEGGMVGQTLTQDVSAAPRLLVKRKAAWRAIVGIPISDAAKASSTRNSEDEIGVEVGTTFQREQETDLDLVRLRFHNQRCVFLTKVTTNAH